MDLGGVDSVQTKIDYLGKVIMPLILNINQHAYNPKNDTYERLKTGFEKGFHIASEVDESRKEIIVTITDNGFGISPAIADRLFTKYASTKKDSKQEHGIGLYAVKQYVEENGGKIWFETERGKWTSFKFTIPYKERKGILYIQ
jgi:two-component system sensor kinase FixL